jgi:hypothetical protein
MSSQKLPLFGGTIQPLFPDLTNPLASLALNPVFTPPDATTKAPRYFALHLWVLPPLASAGLVGCGIYITENPTGKQGAAWAGIFPITAVGGQPVKVLDGYPVRGDVTVAASAVGVAASGSSNLKMWGYYVPVGEGTVREDERRFIGQNLQRFNAGIGYVLGFQLTPPPPLPPAVPAGAPSDTIIHVFEKDRIDEMSLAFTPMAPVACFAVLSFETEANTLVHPEAFATFHIGTGAQPPQGQYSAFPPSPYVIYKAAFGGHGYPTLHHLRVTVGADSPDVAVGVHGYFTRR